MKKKIIIIFIVLAHIAGGAFYYFKLKNTSAVDQNPLPLNIDDLGAVDNTDNDPPIRQTPPSELGNASTTEDLAIGNKYTYIPYVNNKYGYSFSFMTSLTISPDSTDEKVVVAGKPEDGSVGRWVYQVEALNLDKVATDTLEVAAKQELNRMIRGSDLSAGSINSQITDIAVDGVLAKKVLLNNIADYGNTAVVAIANGRLYKIFGDSEVSSASWEGGLNLSQFLSGFKFLKL